MQQHDNVLDDSPHLFICEDTLVSRIMKLAILRYISIKYRVLNHSKVRFERILQAIVVLCMACTFPVFQVNYGPENLPFVRRSMTNCSRMQNVLAA